MPTICSNASREVWEGMHQQLLQFAAMPETRNIRTFPVLGVAKDAPLPIPHYPAASVRTE